VKIEYDFNDDEWIQDARNFDVGSDVVKNIIPERFDYYFKFFFPIGLEDEETEEITKITYRKLAEVLEMPFNGKFGFTSIINHVGGMYEDIVSMTDKDAQMMEDFSEILDAEDECIFHGVGDDVVPEEFMQPWIIRGKVKDFRKVFEQLNRNGLDDESLLPHYIFAENKGWCLGNLIHLSGIYVMGCFEDTAKKVKAQTKIEYVELNADDEYFEFLGKRK